MTAAAKPRKPQDPAKFRRYRERMKARGLKQVRLWVYDPNLPGFKEEMERQAALLRGAPEELEALKFMEGVADVDGWVWEGDDLEKAP